MATRKLCFVASMHLWREDDGAEYTLELRERRSGSQGRLVCFSDVGPFGLSRESIDQWLVALAEVIDHATTTVVALDRRDTI
jgi:hypothetical protein